MTAYCTRGVDSGEDQNCFGQLIQGLCSYPRILLGLTKQLKTGCGVQDEGAARGHELPLLRSAQASAATEEGCLQRRYVVQ